MKKFKLFKTLLIAIGLLVTSINTAWASSTFYVAVGENHTHWDNGCRTFYSNVKYGSSDKEWEQITLSITDYTYNGKTVYQGTHTFSYSGYYNWQFYIKDGSGNDQKHTDWYAGSWNTNLHNGEVFVLSDEEWVSSPSWDDSYTVYFVNAYDWGSTKKAHAWNGYCDYNADGFGQEMTATGLQYNDHDIYRITFSKRYSKIMFNCGNDGCKTADLDCYSNAGKMYVPGTGWITPTFTSGYTFSNGATVVWDAAEISGWTTTHMYYFDLAGDQDIALSQVGSIAQFSYTASSAIRGGSWIFRKTNGWSGANLDQTTNINLDISGVTLFTYDGTNSGDLKRNWQVTSNAKKANGSTKVYFDNSDAKWSNIYLKYGTTWYTRATSAATKVNGTANLYYVTIPSDAYYKEYFLCDATGSTGYVDIETMTSINNRIGYQESNISSEITYIPTSGAGTPKVWTASTQASHTHQFEITAPSNGTITVAYKDESNASQSKTSGSFDVARTCSLTVSATADTGYKLATDGLTIDDVAHTSGSVYIIKDDITIEATFEAKQCTITFDKEGGSGGDDSETATYDDDMPEVSIPHKIGYKFDGYWDGDDGTGNQYYKADGKSYTKWNKDTEDATTLHAKWVADNKTFKADAATTDWATGSNWSGGVAPSDDWSAVTINGEVTLSSSVHIGSLTIGTGKLTIAATGVLEVAGTVTNSNSDKLEIRTTSSSQGALIYDISSSSPSATVYLTTNNAGSGFQLIASPTGGASVSSSFSGEGVYTFAWVEGEGWERRGYYESFVGEPILLKGQTSCNFSGLLSHTCGGSLAFTAKPKNESAQGVNMLVNPLAAPIKVSAMTLTNSADNYVSVWNNGLWAQYSTVSGEDVVPAFNGYAVIASSSGSVSFTYDEAVRGASTKNAPLKAPKQTSDDVQDHITISVTTNGRKVDLPLYEDATRFTDRIDKGYEAIYLEGDGRFGQLYAHADREMSILATPNLEGTVIGFTPGETESYTISFEGDGKGYYLNDIKIGKSILIDEDNIYEFAADESTNDKRFVISKMPMQPTGVDEVADGSKARKQLIDGALYIIRDGRIYTATGAAVK